MGRPHSSLTAGGCAVASPPPAGPAGGIDPGQGLALAAQTVPFFPTQGSLWAGVHVVIVKRWSEGPRAISDLHSGLISYHPMALPFIFVLLPLLTDLKPRLGVVLSLTLLLAGFSRACIGMGFRASRRCVARRCSPAPRWRRFRHGSACWHVHRRTRGRPPRPPHAHSA